MKERSAVQTEDANDADDEATDCKPEHEDTVVDVSQLSSDDGHPGGDKGDSEGKAKANHVIWTLHMGWSLIRVCAVG